MNTDTFNQKTAIPVFLMLPFIVAVVGCAQGAAESPSSEDGAGAVPFCSVYEPPKTEILEFVDGCPVVSIGHETSQKAAGKFDSKTWDAISTRLRVQDRQYAQAVARADGEGFFDDPENIRAVNAFIARRYLKEHGVLDEPSREQLRSHYEKMKGDFGRPETRIGRLLALEIKPPEGESEVEERIAKLLESLESSDSDSDFISLVLSSSEHPSNSVGGVLPPTAESGELLKVEPEVSAALFSIDQEEGISEPFSIGNPVSHVGVVKLEKRIAGNNPAFEDVSAVVRDDYLKERVSEFLK